LHDGRRKTQFVHVPMMHMGLPHTKSLEIRMSSYSCRRYRSRHFGTHMTAL